MEKKRNHAKRNRAAGHGWERFCAKQYIEAGYPHVVTSRSENRSRDNQKIDLVNKDEAVVGRLPQDAQCKNLSSRAPYEQLLAEMSNAADTIPVILHNFTKPKADKNGKVTFDTIGRYAIMHFDDFFKMVKKLKALEDAQVNKTI